VSTEGGDRQHLAPLKLQHHAALSQRQIDEVGQLLGRGLVSKDNRPMKRMTSKLLTCLSNQRRTHMVRFLCCFTVKK